MGIEVSQHEGATVVRPAGERLDLEVAAEFRQELLRRIDDGDRCLVVELSGVSFLDSSGLGALVSALKLLKTSRERRRARRPGDALRMDQRGDVRLAGVQPQVTSLLEIIRLDRVFASFQTVEEAVESFGGGA
jgi:anti-sigma B factor antagonist